MVGIPMASLALVGFLLVAPWPFWRLAASSPVRARRRDQLVLAGALGTYVVVVVTLAAVWPAVLSAIAVVAAVAAVVLWWRSRVDHGRRGAVPPGRIRLHPLDLYDDPDYLLEEAKRHGPIFKIGATFPVPTLTPIICVVGHDLGLELLRDHADALEVYPPFPASRFIPRSFLRSMNDQDHDRYAPLFRHAYARSADQAFERSVVASAQRLLAGMDAACDGAAGVDLGPYLRRFVFEVLARLHFGLEAGSPELDRLAERYRSLDVVGIARWMPQRTRERRWSSLVDAVGRRFDGGPVGTEPCVVAAALESAGTADGAGERGDERATIVGNVLQMQESGTQDLTALLVWVVKHLGDHPDWVDRVRSGVGSAQEAGAGRSIGERVIRESLRLEQSEYLARRTTADIQFHGYRFPKGWRVRVCIREGHRSADAFDRPDVFDPDRWLDRTHPPTEYAPFGLYRHHCLAARLTQRVGAIFVEELARSYGLTITEDGPREHGRFHWRPSHRLRVRLDPLIVD